jgi:hypothetical protein
MFYGDRWGGQRGDLDFFVEKFITGRKEYA